MGHSRQELVQIFYSVDFSGSEINTGTNFIITGRQQQQQQQQQQNFTKIPGRQQQQNDTTTYNT